MRMSLLLTALILSLGCSIKTTGVETSQIDEAEIRDKGEFPVPRIDFSPERHICYRAEEPLRIDGRPDERPWIKAPWTADFVDIEGELKPPPRFRTRLKMLWDDSYFYVFAEMEEPNVWAKLTERDSIIFHDNDFEVFIDPDGDTHRYYELEVNAFGTVWDLFLDRPYRDDGRAVFFWDIRGLKTGIFVYGTLNRPEDADKGWSVEIAIPWEVLRECAPAGRAPLPGEQWRVNFSRVEWRTEVRDGKIEKIADPETGEVLPEDNWVWSPQGLINMHYPEMWGYVQFSGKAAGGGTDEFRPKPEEKAKWALRRVYYGQRNHRLRHGVYTEDLSLLHLEGLTVDGYRWPPTIETSRSTFEALLESEDGSENWLISREGRVSKL